MIRRLLARIYVSRISNWLTFHVWYSKRVWRVRHWFRPVAPSTAANSRAVLLRLMGDARGARTAANEVREQLRREEQA